MQNKKKITDNLNFSNFISILLYQFNQQNLSIRCKKFIQLIQPITNSMGYFVFFKIQNRN